MKKYIPKPKKPEKVYLEDGTCYVPSYKKVNEDCRYQIIIETLRWERIQIHLTGHIKKVKEDAPDVSPENIKFYLYSFLYDKFLEVTEASFNDNSVKIRFNTMNIDNRFPLFDGTWYLCAKIGDEYVYANPGTEYHKNIDGFTKVFDVRKRRFIVHPRVTIINSLVSFEILLYNFTFAEFETYKGFKRYLKDRMFNLLLLLIRLFIKQDGKHILFTSDSREKISGNEECVYKRMLERGLDKEYKIMMSFKPSIKIRRKFREKFSAVYKLAIADYIFIDDYQPIIDNSTFSDKTEIIQLWHAAGHFKTVGYSRIGKPGGTNPFSRSHRNYTKAIVSSKASIPYYSECFGIEEKNVIPTGIPRMDMLFNDASIKTAKKNFYEKYFYLKDKEIIMFAPTFRGSGARSAYYNVDLLDYHKISELCRERNAVMIFKMHPFVSDVVEIPDDCTDVCIDMSHYREINDILLVADLLITDYSSVIFDYCTTERPMLFYAYDLDEYIASRDFYEEFTGFVPGRIVRTFDEMLSAIRENEFEQDKVMAFKHKFFDHFDDGARDRIIDTILLKNGKAEN